MKKRVTGLAVCLCMAAQLFSVNVSADQKASVLSSQIKDGIATIVFSDALNKEAKTEISVEDAQKQDCTEDVSITIDGATLKCDVSDLSSDNATYKMYLPESLGLTSDAEVTIQRKDNGSFSDDLTNVSNWCSVGNYDNSMFNKPNTVPPTAVTGAMKVEKFTAPKNFATTSFTDETLEFDYSFQNELAANCSGFFAALLRVEDVHGTNGYTPLTKAYAFHIMNSGSALVARILRMDDEDVQYMWSAWNTDRMQWAKENLSLTANTPVRFKIETENTTSGVVITAYMAEYTNGVLGEYKQIMKATDAASMYQSGCFAFIGDETTGNIVDNVKVSTKIDETISVSGAESETVTGDATYVSSSIEDGIAKIVFSSPISAGAVGNVTVKDKDKKDCTSNVVVSAKGSTLTCDASALPSGEYTVNIPSSLGLLADAEATITRDVGEGFSDDLTSVSNWCCVETYNDSMFNKPNTVLPATVTGAMKVDKFTAPKNFASASFTDETLEFDYSFQNALAANCSGFFAALLRAEDVYGTGGMLYAKAYSFHIMNDEKTGLVARILRVDGEQVQYIWSSWDDRMQREMANLSLKENTPVRFKIKTENTESGVVITVYQAEYTNGVLGDYTQIMKATDAESKYKSGYFAFAGDKNTGNVVDNVKVSTKTNETITVKSAQPALSNLESMKQWAEERLQTTGKDKLTFVALGGSITQMAGWTEMVQNFFKTNMGVDVELVNSGIGGTGSDYANIRLYDDCISKNPDIVFLDHCVNDYPGWVYWAGKHEYATQFETIVRRLLQLDNPPMIYGVQFTTRKALIGDYQLETNGGVGDKTPGSGDQTLRVMPKDEFNDILDYYNIPNIDIHDYIKSFTTYDKSTGKLTFDYNDSRISSFFDGARNSNGAVSGGYTYKTAIEASDIAALLNDYVHPSSYAKNVYGQYMIDQISSDKDCGFRAAEFKTEPKVNADFSKFNPKAIDLSADLIKNSKRFTVEGNANIYDNPNGLNNPAEKCVIIEASTDTNIKYEFYGNVYGIFTNTALALDPAITLKVDGKGITENNTNYMQLNKMLSSSGKHIAEIIVPAGKKMSLWRIFTDEENFVGYSSFTDKNNNKVVGIDLSTVANSRGMKTRSQYQTNLGWQGILSLAPENSQNHSDQYESLNYSFLVQDWFAEKGYLSNGKLDFPGTVTTYDVKNLFNNARYKALSTVMSPVVYAGDIYTDRITIFGAKNSPDTALKIKLTYSDGTSETKTVDMTSKLLSQAALITPWGASSSEWGSKVMYELDIEADPTKKLSSIGFTGSNNKQDTEGFQILGINLFPEETLGAAYAEIVDANGFNIGSIANYDGKTVSADLCLYNLAGQNKNAKLIFALYDGDKLIKASSENIGFTGEEYKKVNVSTELPEEVNGTLSAKVFIWADDMITPLAYSVDF